MYMVKLKVSGIVLIELSSDSISEMLGDYLVISQQWDYTIIDPISQNFYPHLFYSNVTMEMKA